MDNILEASIHFILSNPISVLSVSGNTEDLLGFKHEALLTGQISLASRIHDQDQDIVDELFSKNSNVLSGTINLRIRQANGRIRCVKGIYTKTDPTNSDGMVLELLLQDAKSLWQALDGQHLVTNFKAMMDNTDDYIYFKDRNHVFTGASQTLVELTEPSEHWTDLLGQTDYDVFSEEYADIYYALEKQVFSGVSIAHDEQEIVDNEGQQGWVDNRKYPIHDSNGEFIGLFGVARDVTERKAAEEQIEKFAYYDSLTQLPNRRFLIERIQHALVVSTRSKNEGALLFLDLDNFKLLNDNFGHDIGDMLLQQLSQRLTKSVRESDTVSRIGGDEFIILLENLNKNHAQAITQANTIAKKILAALNEPYQLDEYNYIGGMSIGITLFQGCKTGVDEIIKQADTAMYQAKRDGRNSLRFFELQIL